MPWEQIYAPTGSLPLDTLLAGLPILLLLGLLATGKVSAHASALAGLVAALLVAIFAYVPAMPDTPDYWERVGNWTPSMLAAAGYGGCFGLLPIGWIVFTAIFLYALTVEAGQFEVVKHSVAALSDDRRIQALLIAFSFGAFVEGAAGFGTPVAISAALMMGAGFRPIYAAGLALLANTSPVAFGALGTPIITLADVANLPFDKEEALMKLSQMAGRQLPIFSLIVPVWLVWVMSGWRGVVGVWPALLVSGGSFALVQFLVANYHGPWLVDVAGGLVSLILLALFMRIWKPKTTWHFPEEQPPQATDPAKPVFRQGQVVYAWMPWVFLSVLVFAWGVPQVKAIWNDTQNQAHAAVGLPGIKLKVDNLHEKIQRGSEVVQHPKAEEAVYTVNLFSATGTGIFLAAILSAFWLRIGPRRFAKVFGQTCYRVRWALFTIICMLAIAYVTRYSGMDASLGLVFKKTGWFYPLFAAMLGWLGVALTGSDTSSNALFGSLQTMTASQLVADGTLPLETAKAQVLMAAANSTGGVMGKMIDAQSIVVASAATHQHNQEGAILRFVFWHSIILAVLMGLLVMFQAYVWTSVIP